MQETWVRSLGQEDPLEKEMATHSSTLAWEIPWMEEPDRLVHGITKSRTWLSDIFSLKIILPNFGRFYHSSTLPILSLSQSLETTNLSAFLDLPIFSRRVGCLFTSLTVFLEAKFKTFNFEIYQFFSVLCAFGARSKKPLPNPKSWRFTSKFSSKSFRSVIYLQLIFVYGVEMATHSNTLAWKILWWRSLVGYSPWGRKELDTTEQKNTQKTKLWCGGGVQFHFFICEYPVVPVQAVENPAELSWHLCWK